jgi:hypothetical protein
MFFDSASDGKRVEFFNSITYGIYDIARGSADLQPYGTGPPGQHYFEENTVHMNRIFVAACKSTDRLIPLRFHEVLLPR